MRIRPVLFLLIFLGVLSPKTQAANPQSIEVAPAPAWAELIPLDQLKSDNKEEATLLDDLQVHVGQEEEFQRTVIRMTSAQAVQRFSQLSFSFDPSYQKLIVHHLRIYRKGTFVDVPVTPEQFRVVQVEKDLERYLYNGAMSALWFLEDIRVGDIVDYAVTVKGRNPVFDGHFMEHVSLEAEAPCALTRFKILSPLHLKLHIETFNSKIQPKTFETADLRIHQWTLEHLRPPKNVGQDEEDEEEEEKETVTSTKTNDKEPYRQPWIQISDFPNWESVRDWSLKYYTVPTSQTPEIKALVEQFQTESPELKDQIKAAIQFVQQEIRYLGIEMGSSSHQPAKPEEVLRRRFGDCKDKSMLLCTLLMGLGVQAGPAFVNADSDSESETLHPSVYAFNHCVVQFNFKGSYYWIDATMETQRGPIEGLYFPGFKRALVPSFKSDPYTYVVPANKGVPYTEVSEIFDSKDYQQPASLNVTMSFQNLAADQLRAYFLDHDQKEFEKAYLKLYQKIYPKITQEGEMLFTDNPEQNNLKITVKYNIPEFWLWHAGYRCYYSVFYAQNIALSMVNSFSPDGRTRCHVRELMEINVPPGAHRPPTPTQVKNSLLEYSSSGRREENRMILNFEYQNHAEFLTKKETVSMLSDLTAIRHSLAFDLVVEAAPQQNSGNRAPEPKAAKKFY